MQFTATIPQSVVPVIILVITLAGCAQTTYTSLIPKSFPPAQEMPEVLFQPPNRPFVIIGLLEANGRPSTTRPELIDSMKIKAKKFGAQAVYVLAFEQRNVQKGILYETIPIAYGLAVRYVIGEQATAKELYGKWEGMGVSTIAGEFTLLTTLMRSEGGVTGVVTASSGFSGTINGFVSGDTVELIAVPSDFQKFCILKFVGKFDGADGIQGQYTSVLCDASEGGVIELRRRTGRQPGEPPPKLTPNKSTVNSL